MARITPHLWFAEAARQTAEFYTSLFENSSVEHSSIMKDTPSGDAELVSFTLAGQPFEAISAGPVFQLNESISLMVSCSTAAEVDRLWAALLPGGTVMMALDAYPFSPRYGWLADRFGVHWQIMLVEGEQPQQRIVPCLLFSGDRAGQAEEAARFYQQIFPQSNLDLVSHYAPGEAMNPKAKATYVGFTIKETNLVAMDNAMDTGGEFNEAFSLIVACETQQEIDRYWSALSAVPEAEACGWLKDCYGVSWQIVPTALEKMLLQGTPEQQQRVTAAFMEMKKFDIQRLQAAFDGNY